LFLVLERLDGAGVVLQAQGDLTLVLHTLHHLTQIINLNRIKEEKNSEVGSAACFSGPQYTIPQLCFRSAQNAITQCFQICQCAMRNAAIADTSATHNHSKESKRGKLVALLVLLLRYCGSNFLANRRKGFVSFFVGNQW
jgi:hypothetical protein